MVNEVKAGAHVVPALNLEEATSEEEALSTEEILSAKEENKAHGYKQSLL